MLYSVNSIKLESQFSTKNNINKNLPVVQNKHRMLTMVTPAGQDTYHIAHVLVI